VLIICNTLISVFADISFGVVFVEYVYQKQQRTTNIVDELWLLTESHGLYYISQGRVETPTRRGGQFCCSFVSNLFQYLCAKIYQNIM